MGHKGEKKHRKITRIMSVLEAKAECDRNSKITGLNKIKVQKQGTS